MRKRNPRKSAILQMERDGAQMLAEEARTAVTWLAAEVTRKIRKDCCFCEYRHFVHCVQPPTDDGCKLAIESTAYQNARAILHVRSGEQEVEE